MEELGELDPTMVIEDDSEDERDVVDNQTSREHVSERNATKGGNKILEFVMGEKSNLLFSSVVGGKNATNLRFYPPSTKADTTIAIPLELAKEAAKKYHTTLFGYFLGHRIHFQVMQRYVKTAWSKFGFVDMMMNSNGYCFFKFNNEGGCSQVVENGPLMIRGVPLFVFPWDPSKGLTKPIHTTCPL